MYCTSCGTEINGAFCSGCGNRAWEPKTVNVENFSRGKNDQLIGAVILALALFVVFGYSDNKIGLVVGLLMLATGIGFWISGKFQHWYHAE
jgi:hypothetical protein